MQTDVKVYLSFFQELEVKNTMHATIYQVMTWLFFIRLWFISPSPDSKKTPTYLPNFSDRVGAGETEIILIMAQVYSDISDSTPWGHHVKILMLFMTRRHF